MATEIAKRDIPTPTPQIARSLSPDQLSAHRQAIAFDVKTILSAYFQPHEDERIKAAQLAWWCDELQDWTQEQVLWALRKWNRDNPDRRPTPGHILSICKDARGKKFATTIRQPEPEPERKPVNRERAAAIMAEAGFAPRKFGGDA